ncbi:MAG: hypothetical protein FE78DRAFT_76774 [Acidomyces sp. 'richmondensis']|nr:MAG: hypothetical protein FE78DRAFT_76774 [Acidomyces sp. 'richmondensis']
MSFARLDKLGTPLRVGDASMPLPGPDDIVIQNRAIAINPLYYAQAGSGFMVKEPYLMVLGSDVAGEVYSIGANVSRFKIGDRVSGHFCVLATWKPEDRAFGRYSRVRGRAASKVPDYVAFNEAAVMPLARGTAISGLHNILEIDYPTIDAPLRSKVIVVYGASSSIGSIQHNHSLVKSCGASAVFDYRSDMLVHDIVTAVGKDQYLGVYDAISNEETYSRDLAILAALVWEKYVTPALEKAKLKALPEPLVVGRGLEYVQTALYRTKSGMSGQKVVVEL